MQDIWVSLHSIRSRINRFLASSSTNPRHCNFSYDVINDFFVQRVFISSDTGHHQLEAFLRSAHLQGLPEVGPARLLAAMLRDLSASILRSIKTMTQFSSLLSIKPAMLPASMRGDYSMSASSTPSCFPRHTDMLGNLCPITSFLDLLSFLFWIIIPSILPTTMLVYYSMSASSMPSDFFIVVSIYLKSDSNR
jgi:hypothetical protein